jgi:hypothetical protein
MPLDCFLCEQYDKVYEAKKRGFLGMATIP